MATPMQPHLLEFPTELVTAVVGEASRDAERVDVFLKRLGLENCANRTVQLPAHFFLDLGAALRLLDWEERGIGVHLDVGLPPARQAVREVLLSLTAMPDSPSTPADSLAYRVMIVFIEHFAWSGCAELGADVTLGETHEEAFLELLADFLWEHRPR